MTGETQRRLVAIEYWLYGGLKLFGEEQNYSEGGTKCRDHLGDWRKWVINLPVVNIASSDYY